MWPEAARPYHGRRARTRRTIPSAGSLSANRSPSANGGERLYSPTAVSCMTAADESYAPPEHCSSPYGHSRRPAFVVSRSGRRALRRVARDRQAGRPRRRPAALRQSAGGSEPCSPSRVRGILRVLRTLTSPYARPHTCRRWDDVVRRCLLCGDERQQHLPPHMVWRYIGACILCIGHGGRLVRAARLVLLHLYSPSLSRVLTPR